MCVCFVLVVVVVVVAAVFSLCSFPLSLCLLSHHVSCLPACSSVRPSVHRSVFLSRIVCNAPDVTYKEIEHVQEVGRRFVVLHLKT